MSEIYVVCKTKAMSDEPIKAFTENENAIKWVRKNSTYIGFKDEELNRLSGFTITKLKLE